MSAYSSANNAGKAQKIVGILAARFGEIPWWPGDTDEVMIGAILTQQTRWENVKRGLRLLREKGLCSMTALDTTEEVEIESAIRCTGFYRMKARRSRLLLRLSPGPAEGWPAWRRCRPERSAKGCSG